MSGVSQCRNQRSGMMTVFVSRGTVNMEEGCRNFERLPGTHEVFAILADEYAKSRGFDVKKCLELIEQAHK